MVPKNPKQTSSKIVKLAAKKLADPSSSSTVKKLAGSALSQAPKAKKR